MAGRYFEREAIEAFLALLRPEDVVYEVGGHIGSWTVFLARRAAKGWVHVFEPEPRSLSRLDANVALNGLGNVTAHAHAASDRSGRTAFGVVDGLGEGRHSLDVGPEHHRVVEVETLALDEAPARLRIAPPTALKVDVEGSEGRVLRGARALLGSIRVAFLEIHRAPDRAALRRTMAEAGLEPHTEWDRGPEQHVIFHRPEAGPDPVARS